MQDEEKIVPFPQRKSSEKLFTKEFLSKLQKKYDKSWQSGILDSLMNTHQLSFHDAICLLAQWKKMEPEYFEKRNDS